MYAPPFVEDIIENVNYKLETYTKLFYLKEILLSDYACVWTLAFRDKKEGAYNQLDDHISNDIHIILENDNGEMKLTIESAYFVYNENLLLKSRYDAECVIFDIVRATIYYNINPMLTEKGGNEYFPIVQVAHGKHPGKLFTMPKAYDYFGFFNDYEDPPLYHVLSRLPYPCVFFDIYKIEDLDNIFWIDDWGPLYYCERDCEIYFLNDLLENYSSIPPKPAKFFAVPDDRTVGMDYSDLMLW